MQTKDQKSRNGPKYIDFQKIALIWVRADVNTLNYSELMKGPHLPFK